LKAFLIRLSELLPFIAGLGIRGKSVIYGIKVGILETVSKNPDWVFVARTKPGGGVLPIMAYKGKLFQASGR